MPLPAPTPPNPAQLLCEAEQALHKLKLGQLTVELEFDGRKVRYAHTDMDALTSYVADLRNQIAGVRPRHGAIGFYL